MRGYSVYIKAGDYRENIFCHRTLFIFIFFARYARGAGNFRAVVCAMQEWRV